MIRRLFLACIAALLSSHAAQGAPTPQEQARIDALIRFVEGQQGMQFIRNGKAYSCAEAAEFLRRKMDAMGAEVSTAREFIERIGSKSSTSGKPYQVKFDNGRALPAAQFLGDELARIERPPA
jgi:Family of unknown function (DUF5329)